MTLLEKMETEKLSATEEHVVHYMLDHEKEISHLSLEALAKETYTSNATIIRLCRKLGYDGYRSFKLAFVMELEMQKFVHHEVDFSLPFNDMQNMNEVFYAMGSLYKETIDICLKEVDVLEVNRLAKEIKKAHRVFIFAVGDSMITAKAFANKLIKLDIYPILTSETDEEVSHSYNAKAGDLLLFVSYDLKLAIYHYIRKEVIDSGAVIAVITTNRDSPIAKKAKYKIFIEKYENDDNIATFYSQLSFEFILNYLYACLYSLNYQKNHQRKSMISMLRSKTMEK